MYFIDAPLMYTAPDGNETTIFIIHANTSWEKLANGSHVAIHFSNPGVDKYGDQYQQTLYDPSGCYEGPENKGRYSSGLFTGSEADKQAYIDSVLNRKHEESINIYTIDSTPEEEAKMIERALELGDGNGVSCADNGSDVLKILGFKHVITPGGLERQLEKSTNVKKESTNEE